MWFCYQVLKEAVRLYAASWVRDIGPELRPNHYKKKNADGEASPDAPEQKEPSVLEDLGGFVLFPFSLGYVLLEEVGIHD